MPHPLFPTLLIAYLAILLLVGAWKARTLRDRDDFHLAGRSLGATVLAGTLIATWIGTGSIFGNAEEAYSVGLATWLLPLAGAAGIFVLWRLASRLRSNTHVTVQDLLEERFGPGARIMGTIALIAGYIVIVSYQYRAGAAVLRYAAPELTETTAVCLVAFIVILYTALAGMASVARTDLVNGVLMTFGVLAVLAVQLVHFGGPAGVIEALPAGHQQTSGHYPPIKILSILLPAFLLVLGDANLYQRFFSAKDPGTARRSALWMLGGVLLLEYAILALALCGRARVEAGDISAPAHAAHIVIHLAFADPLLPVWLGALLLATVVAVIVSTADSYLLSPATSLVRDVWERFGPGDAASTHPLLLGRTAVLILGLIALGIAFTSDSFFDLALFAYTLYGATITPALLAALFWPRATARGALLGMLTGLTTALAWRFIIQAALLHGLTPGSSTHDLISSTDAVIPALLAATIALVGFSLTDADPRNSSAPGPTPPQRP
jgi:SSS family transporter